MKAVIGKWIAWLRSAAAGAGQLAHVYSDGTRLWAGDGHRLHALDVATERPGRYALVMPATGAQAWWFWRPGEDDNPPPPGDK